MHTLLPRHGRSIALVLVVLLLAACGTTPEPQAVEPVASTAAAVEQAASAAVAPSVAIQAEASAVAPSSSVALTDEEKAAQLQTGYGPLVLLSASLAAADETARRAQSGEISDVETMGRVIGLAAVVDAAKQGLAGEPPIPPVAAVWEDARAAATELQGLINNWNGQQITADDVVGELEPLAARVETMIQAAEGELGAQYEIPGAELEQIRTDAIARLRENLASSAAVPALASEPSAVALASAAPEAPAAPADEQPGTSRAAPLAIGTPVVFETWAVTVTDVQRGDAAREAIAAANQFNTPPRDGFEYLLVTMQLENVSPKPEAQDVVSGVGLRATGERNVSYPMVGAVPPQPLQGQLFPRGATTGQQVVEVPSGEANLMLVLNELVNFEVPARFVAVDDQARVTPDTALDAIAPTDVGASRDAPAGLAETVVTEDWEVTLLEAKRGEEAAAMVTAANQFNQPAPAGSEYVLLRVRVRSIGTAQPDLSQNAALGALKLVGASNVVYEAPAVVGPEPRLDALLFPGGEAEGWVVLSAAQGEQNLLAIWQPLFSFDDTQTRYLALE